jgi:hypothetical protein
VKRERGRKGGRKIEGEKGRGRESKGGSNFKQILKIIT